MKTEYVICQEMGRLTLFHYYLANDGRFYIATNDARKFPNKKSALMYARTIKKHWPDLILYVMGPRKGQTPVRTSRGAKTDLIPCLIGRAK